MSEPLPSTDEPSGEVREEKKKRLPVILGDASKERPPTLDTTWAQELRAPLTAAFVITLISGMIVEIFLNAAFAAAIMLIYFALGLRLNKSTRNSERFADSLYYQGFILTLFALLLAMQPWATGGSVHISSQDIIQKFGMAITTTFLGMALRVILIQMRPTISDQDEESQESISLYIANLNRELAEAVKDVAEFRKKISTSMRQASKEFSDSLEKASSESGAILSARTKEISDQLVAVSKEFVDAVKAGTKILKDTKKAVADMQEGVGDVLDASRDAKEVIGNASELSEKSAANMAKFATQAQSASNELKSMEQVAKQFATKVKELNDAIERTPALSGQIETAAISMKKLGVLAEELAKWMPSITATLNSLGSSYRTDVEAATGRLTIATDKLTELADEARSLGDDVSRAFVDSATKLKDAISEAGKV